MNYYGVTEWDQVLAIFGKGGALEGKWGWLATLRDAEVGDTISLHYGGESLFTGALATENGAFYLSNDVSRMSLTSAEKLSWDGYEVTKDFSHPELLGMPLRDPRISNYYEATKRNPVFKYDPNKYNFVNSVLDVTSFFASVVGGNPLTNGVKTALVANAAEVGKFVGTGTSIISAGKMTFVDGIANSSPNAIITTYGGFIPIIGGAFSLAALFYDLGFYQTY